MGPGQTVIVDANVLYSSTARDVLIRLSMAGMFRARWSDQILDEVFSSLKENRPDLDAQKLRLTQQRMCDAIDDCMVYGYESLIDDFELPDPDDRHVVAAAVAGDATIIVSDDRTGFPESVLSQYGIVRQSLDEFLCGLIASNRTLVSATIEVIASTRRHPPCTVGMVLDGLARDGAPSAARALGRAQ